MVVGVTVTMCDVPVATNVNHTSSSAVPAHATCDCVAPTLVELVVAVQLVPEFTVNEVAPEQLSLAIDTAIEIVHVFVHPAVVVPVTVYVVALCATEGVPDMEPVEDANDNPVGIVGEIEKLLGLPVNVGLEDVIAEFWSRENGDPE